jgi:phosphoglycolate phosphatase
MPKADFSRIKALIFDLDGTLIDSKQDLVTSVNAMLFETGRRPLSADTIASYVGSGASVLVRRALGGEATRGRAQEGAGALFEALRGP